MSALEDVDNGLGHALDRLAQAAAHLDDAHSSLEGTGICLAVLIGTNDDEAQQALAHHAHGFDQLGHVQEMVQRCGDRIQRYRTSVATTSTADIGLPDTRARMESRPQLSPPRGWDAVEGDKPNPAEIGVRRRRSYILDGDGLGGGGHLAGTGLPNKMEFPAAWDDDKIVTYIEDIARNPGRQPKLQANGRWRVQGTREDVDIRVVMDKSGRIHTAYPVGGVAVIRNDENGKPNPTDSTR